MKKLFAFIVSLFLSVSSPALSSTKGYLFVIGGMASSVPAEVGPEQAEQLRQLGAENVECHILTREQALKEESAAVLNDAGGVFFSGGVQSRLTAVLIDTPVHKKLLQLYTEGAVIGGTSAGAAVMSEVMITGDEKREAEEGHAFETLQADNVVTIRGFGFIQGAIIDQHFVRRKRHNRLISLVAENPKLLGIGIDESTAIIVGPDNTFEVVGERNVIVFDASRAKVKIGPSQTISGSNMIMHILQNGDRFDLKTRKVLSQYK